MMIPAGDDKALAARVEKLERNASFGTSSTQAPVAPIAEVKSAPAALKSAPKIEEKVEATNVEAVSQ